MIEYDNKFNESQHILIAYKKDIGYVEVYLKTHCDKGKVYSTPIGKIQYNGVRSMLHLIKTLKQDGYKLYYTNNMSVPDIIKYLKELNAN